MNVQAIFYANPDGYPPIINGARLLAASGHRVDLLCRVDEDTTRAYYPPAVSVRRLQVEAPRTWQSFFSFVWQALRLADIGTTVFIGHDMHGLLVARLLAARRRRPLIYHCHDFVEDGAALNRGGRLVKAFEARFARTADLVIVPDAERAQVVARALGLRRPPLVVGNAPLQRAEPSTRLQEVLAERGIHFSRILFRQGRIGSGHAIEATIRSMPLWREASWGFVIIGRQDEAYNETLRELARRNGVAERFVILPTVRSYDEVALYTAGADIGNALYEPTNVNNVYMTTASNKTMEYMAAGLPLLVSDRPGFRALVERYACGLIADESDPASIAAAVNALLGDPERARQMGSHAAQAFEQEFRYDRQFAPVLEELCRLART